MIVQVVFTLAIAPAAVVVAQAVATNSYAGLLDAVARGYKTLIAELRAKAHGSWITSAAPLAAFGLAAISAAALPTMASTTAASAFGDVLALGFAATAIGVLALMAGRTAPSSVSLSSAVFVGAAVLFSGVSLMLLGFSGDLGSIVRATGAISPLMILPVVSYVVVAGEFLRPSTHGDGAARGYVDLARATFAAAVLMFAGRLVVRAPLVSAQADTNTVALAVLSSVAFALLGAALCGGVRLIIAKYGFDHVRDRAVIALIVSLLAVLGALIASLV